MKALTCLAVCISLIFTTAATYNSNFEQKVKYQINQVRIPKIKGGTCVDNYSEQQARRIKRNGGELVHSNLQELLKRCKANWAGEVLARGDYLPSEAVDAWMGSYHHRRIITDPVYRRMGVGVVRYKDKRIIVVNFVRH